MVTVLIKKHKTEYVCVFVRRPLVSERFSKLPSLSRTHTEAAVSVQMWETEICYENLSTLYIAAPRAAKICILLF